MSGPSWGLPPWHIELPPGRAALPERCDVAVVGAGFTGLAAAYTLARPGLAVVVFEARRLGAGASGRSGGIVLEGTSAGPLPEAAAYWNLYRPTRLLLKTAVLLVPVRKLSKVSSLKKAQ